MSAALSNQELEIVNALRRTGVALPAATLAVVMSVREHARPVSELADIVRQYQGLEDQSVAEQSIRDLERLGWLVESQSYGASLIHQAPDLQDLLADKLNDPAISQQLREMRSYLAPDVKIVGAMKDRLVYETYMSILSGAQREICLPMLATTPRLEAVPIIQERASKGVTVRILLGSPELTARLRGSTMTRTAKDSIHGWLGNAENHPNIRVRISNSAEDMQIASSMLIDGRLLRFDVYDPSKQRSLEGVMIQIESPPTLDLNLITQFQRHFNQAWNNAKPTSGLEVLLWHLGKLWRWYCFFIFTGLVFLSVHLGKSNWTGIFSSASATFLVNAFASSFESIRSRFPVLRDLR